MTMKATRAYTDGRRQEGGVVARDGGGKRGRGRGKGAHRGINIDRPRCKRGRLRHNGQHDIYSHVETSGARWGERFSAFHAQPCADFLKFSSAIDFGAPLARLVRQPSFSNFELACPLCPPCLHGPRAAPAPRPLHTQTRLSTTTLP